MENNRELTTKEAVAITLRCIKDINRYVPGRIPAMVLQYAVAALKPYVTIWFSAQLINELAGQRRADELWKWAILTITLTALVSLIYADIGRWVSAIDSIHNFTG